MSYTYIIFGIVKNVAGGEPLKGVEIDIVETDRNGFESNKGGVGFPVVTDRDGKFRFEWTTLSERPSFILNLKKAGYSDESVDISPQRVHPSGQGSVHLVLASYMRPSEPDE